MRARFFEPLSLSRMPFNADPGRTDMVTAYLWSGPPERRFVYCTTPAGDGEIMAGAEGGKSVIADLVASYKSLLACLERPDNQQIIRGSLRLLLIPWAQRAPYRSNLSHRVYVVRRKGKRSAMMVLERANNHQVLRGKIRRHLVKDLGGSLKSVTMSDQGLTTLLFIL
jgi:hypothetical protein